MKAIENALTTGQDVLDFVHAEKLVHSRFCKVRFLMYGMPAGLNIEAVRDFVNDIQSKCNCPK